MFSVDAVSNQLPALTIVVGLVQIGAEIVGLVASSRDIGTGRIEWVYFDAVDHHPFRHAPGCDVSPIFSIVTSNMDEPVITASPDHASFVLRLGDGEDGAVVFHRGVILGDRSARLAHGAGVIAGQVGTNLLPALTFITCTEQHLCRCVDHIGIMRRDQDREVPLEPIANINSAIAHGIIWPYVHHARFAGVMIQPLK